MLYNKFNVGFAGLYLSVALMFSPYVFAQSGLDYLGQGIKAARSGDYRAALVQFQKAETAGLDSPTLQYNLGVAYYRLGQYENSKKAFTKVTGEPGFKQRAYYNLGLVANKQKDKTAAISWFQRAFHTGKSDKVKILSREAMKRLGVVPKKVSASKKKWTGFLSTSLSSDSNVTLVNDDLTTVSSKGDTSMILSAFGAKWLTGGSANGVRLYLRGYAQRYSAQTNYDYSQLGLGAAHYNRLGDWKMRFGGFWDDTYLGGLSYQRVLSAELRGRRALSKNNQLRLRYKISSIDATDPIYDYLGGTRQQIRAGAQMKNKTSRYRMYYQLELNDRDDDETPSDTAYLFKSYSPTRHTLRITGWWDITNMWKLRLDGRYRTSEYNDSHILASSATTLRDDTQSRFSAHLSRKLSKKLKVEASYTLTNNDSSIVEESYDRDLTSIKLNWDI